MCNKWTSTIHHNQPNVHFFISNTIEELMDIYHLKHVGSWE